MSLIYFLKLEPSFDASALAFPLVLITISDTRSSASNGISKVKLYLDPYGYKCLTLLDPFVRELHTLQLGTILKMFICKIGYSALG